MGNGRDAVEKRQFSLPGAYRGAQVFPFQGLFESISAKILA